MKFEAIQKFRQTLRSGAPVHGLWVTLESASITEMAVALGLDWVVIDAEHGHLDWRDILEHVRATVRSDTVVLVRVAENSSSLIKRVLDIGADGVVVPWIETADQLRAALRYAKYPPDGARGVGAERATCWTACIEEQTRDANKHVLVVPLLESVTAMSNVAEIAQVDGADVFFFGPHDLSCTAGQCGVWEGSGVPQMLEQAKQAILGQGKTCGLLCGSPEDRQRREAEGYRMLGIGLDGALLVGAIRSAMSGFRPQKTPMHGSLTFTRENDPAAVTDEQPLVCAPASMRPDRPEVMISLREGPQVQIEAGVSMDTMVGGHNNARNLTTGFVTFEPSRSLAYHTHTFGETITLMAGQLLVEVQGRRYTLSPLDNVTIPAGLAHSALNLSSTEPAVVHVALASHAPSRTLVDRFFSRRSMPRRSHREPGGECFTVFADAKRYEPGENASFVDYFNGDMAPGFELSGGYGLFQPGGRLPAHLHDFDESISIVQGNATCIVEGRRHQMGAVSAALQPRGRIHYFVNESNAPMAMIWVYAGPTPERLVVDDRCANAPAAAWG